MKTTENEGIDVQLARFAVDTKYSDIPEDMVMFAKHLALKCVADIVAGASMPASRKLAALVRARNTPGDAGVVGYGFRSSLWDAVFLNAFFAHAAELEDDAFQNADYLPSGASWTITVGPLLLSVAEKLRLSGKDLILALVVGLEVHRRTCLSHTLHRGIMLGPGAMGPAVAASKALGLNIDQTLAAMGLATSAPFIAMANYGTDAHFFESALQSMQGVIAAEMAKQGMIGKPDLAAYLYGLLGKEEVDVKAMGADLGSRWLAKDFWIKKYPCSFGAHCAADLAIELREQHDLPYQEVETIEVSTALDFPQPRTIEQAQVSVQHVLAVAICDGDVNLSHFTEEALVDPVYEQVRSKVRIVAPPELETRRLFDRPERVVIRMKDGREFSGERSYPIGSYKEPLSEQQVRDLYRKYTAGVLSANQIESTADAILSLEKLNDIEELMDILTFRHRSEASRGLTTTVQGGA